MIREITITPVLNGFVCKVGCQTVVFESISEMIRNLEAYCKDSSAVEKEFLKKAVNKMNDGSMLQDKSIMKNDSSLITFCKA
jgi:hypothetical protein